MAQWQSPRKNGGYNHGILFRIMLGKNIMCYESLVWGINIKTHKSKQFKTN